MAVPQQTSGAAEALGDGLLADIEARATEMAREAGALLASHFGRGKLEELSEKGRLYDYYHCEWCHRIWRIMRVDSLHEDYQPPQRIGSWDSIHQDQATVSKPPRTIPGNLKLQYCRSKRNSRRSAKIRKDAQGY